MFLTVKGEEVEVPGVQPKVGEQAPAFTLKDADDQVVTLESLLEKPVILSIIPNIETSVCALQTKRFNQEASELSAINFATISNNTREQQTKWCGQEGVNMLMLHDPNNTLDEGYHLLIPDLGIYARAIFVLDTTGKIVYEEIVSEVAEEPNYAEAIKQAKSLV